MPIRHSILGLRGTAMTDYLSDPETLQFEITSMCNALCLGCPRTDTTNFNHTKPCIPSKSIMSLDTITNIFGSRISKNIKRIEFCGTIDEPLMHPYFFEILDLVYSLRPDIRISIHTNGSLRSETEWAALAKSLNRFTNGYLVWFSIDGLEDTHSLYRQNTDFSKIIRNAKAFITAGGQAAWQYIIFPWNSHQVEIAKNMAAEMQFSKFKTRNDRSQSDEISFEEIRLRKEKDAPSDFYNLSNDGTFQNLEEFDNLEIDCSWKKSKMLFVSHDNKLWPCCFFSNERYSTHYRNTDLEKRLYNNYGTDFNDLSINSLDDILNHRFFKSQLTISWKNKIGFGETDKVARCARTCSKKGLEINPLYRHELHNLDAKEN